MQTLKELLSFKIDNTNFAIRVVQINSRLRSYPQIVLSQMVIAFFLVGLMWNGVAHKPLLVWLALVWSAHATELIYWLRFHKKGNNINDCQHWNVRFYWFAGILGAIWGSTGLLMFLPGQILYQMFLITVVLGISAGAVTSNPIHPPSLFIHLAGLVSPLLVRVFWEGDWTHLLLGSMLLIYLLFVLNAARELIYTFEQSLQQRIDNETLAAKFKQAQSIAHIGSWHYDFVTDQTNWTDELYRVYGVSPETFMPSVETLCSLIHPDDQSIMQAWIEACSSGKMPQALEFRCVWPDGTIRYIEGHGELVLDAEGMPSHMSGTARDITKRRQSEAVLAESIRKSEEKELAKTRFLAAASHDLRQPLAAANLFIDSLKFTSPNVRQHEIIQHLERSMSSFNGLLDALLNISKLDTGVIKPEVSSITVSEIFNSLKLNYLPIASDKGLEFRLHFPVKEPLVVKSDIGLLNSIFSNLISNAIKYTAKGFILVSARRRGSDALFQVWDSGIGVEDKEIPAIFDEFYQVSNQNRDRTQGLGLGLSIVERSIALLGSEITIRSQIGHGSIFEFHLPLDNSSRGANENERALQKTIQSDKIVNDDGFVCGKCFVVAEDDELVAQAMRNLLENMGGQVKCFSTAEDVLLDANIKNTDYFIVDYMLGGKLDGMQLLSQLQQHMGNPINAVLVSGDTSSSFILKSTKFYYPVLHKPVNERELIAGFKKLA